MDPPPSVDLLSSLPEHLQDEILTCLDLRDAVRTSVLSRAWRRRWETLPGLDLSFPDGTPATVIYRVLLRYAGPSVSRFKTHVDATASHVTDWLIALSRRSIESISIFNDRGDFTVHSSIFSCDRLVSLTLEQCCIPLVPQSGGGFAGFPVLKELYLTYVDFEGEGENQLRSMIRASPMLRVLLLEEVYGIDTDCVIDAPNLHTLGFISRTGFEWQFGDLPCLQYASINVPGYAFVEVLAVVSQVQELILNLPLQQSNTVASRKFPRAQWTDGICANLTVVQINSYQGWLPLYFIKLILSKASLLRTLSVDACPVSQDDRLNELTVEELHLKLRFCLRFSYRGFVSMA